MSVRCLFIVQGEGRGHLTQALSLRRQLRENDHRIAEVIVGKSRRRAVPSFFQEGFDAPVTFVDSPSFVPDADDQSVRPWVTLVHELARTPTFLNSLATIRAAVERHEPDVIVNFFEPLTGFFAARYRPTVPIVAIGHQYMFHHPEYRFPPGRWWKRSVARAFASVTAWGASRRLALSLYPVASSVDDLAVLPPLLREAVFRQSVEHSAPFFLVYILNSGYADAIIRWHEQNPDVPLHCFWDRPGAAQVEAYDDTLTFHQLDDKKFLSFMARCRGFVSTAGFESIAEAMYLGTPVQVVPVEGHFEQLCNSFDAVRARAGIRSTHFDLSQLQAFLPRYTADISAFREWIRHSQDRFVRHIEAAAERRTGSLPTGVPEPERSVMEPVQ